MVNPVTVNAGIIVPLTGADVDQWGELDVNPNMVAIDGLLCGVQTISASNVPITLTVPAGFVATPSGGPTQSQNRVLRFTGTLTADVVVTLPIPGVYVVENMTSGNFVLSFRGITATEVIGTPQGERLEIYNDGANVRFVNLARCGAIEMWGGLSAIPAWVTACTVKPYVLNDGSVYNISDFPTLGARFGSKFGGNGLTTFGVPDLRGRVPLAYDGTGTRITVAGCGINGQTLGANMDTQTVALTASKIPTITGTAAVATTASGWFLIADTTTGFGVNSFSAIGGGAQVWQAFGAGAITSQVNSLASAGTTSSTNTGGTSPVHNNVQPVQVVGISVTKT